MKKFKLLVLGGDHIYGQLPAAGQSYVEQLARRLAQEGLRLTVECHAPTSLVAMAQLLPRLPLQQYDLIVLQPGHGELQRPAALRALFTTTHQPPLVEETVARTSRYRSEFGLLNWLGNTLTVSALRMMALAGLPRLGQTRRQLRTVLDSLQPCGHNVILMTPFPHRDAVSGWLRRQGQRVFLEEGHRAFMPVFDAYAQLDVGDVCFLPDNPAQLNALGHELVGSALYDFFRAVVMTADDSSSYRRH